MSLWSLRGILGNAPLAAFSPPQGTLRVACKCTDCSQRIILYVESRTYTKCVRCCSMAANKKTFDAVYYR